MKIAIIDTLGLCYDATTLSKRGLGGSESAVILMSKELANLGFKVTVFNDCNHDDATPGMYDGVMYTPLSNVETDYDYDIMIGSRSVAAFSPNDIKIHLQHGPTLPDFTNIQNRSNYKVLWMHDTFCDGDHLVEPYCLAGRIQKVFTLSDFHTTYVTTCTHGNKRMYEVIKPYIWQTRNGITKYKNWVDVLQKDPNLFVYNASVTKGMIPLVEKVWPKLRQHIPNAKLKIIGGYYRFRSDQGPDEQENKFHELAKLSNEGIDFTGIIKQSEIADILAEASFMLYPSAFPETFGISSLESLCYNTPLITCSFGALEETAIDIACYKIPYSIEPNGLYPFVNTDEQVNKFVEVAVMAHRNKYLHQQKMYACNQIKDICGWDSVALQWKQHFFKVSGQFLNISEYRKVTNINKKVHKVFGRRNHNPEEMDELKNSNQKRIVVVTPVYNSENYIERCIRSIAQQDYDNYKMIIVDDASSDNTLNVIKNTLQSLPIELVSRFTCIENPSNHGAVFNQINTILNTFKDNQDDIVMLLDGDDWLINDPNIFHKYNNMYHEGAEFTYGSCWSLVDNIPLIAQPYPPEVKANKSYRQYKFNWNMPYTHLRTFDIKLIKDINLDVFKDDNGNWLRAGGDTAVFYNILEAANPENVICVPEIIYNYNDTNPLNDYKVNGEEQTKTANKVLTSKLQSNKFSIVVPTMWRCPLFLNMLSVLVNCDRVGEIIIINNDNARLPSWNVLSNSKVRLVTVDSNVGVNPAWNMGVDASAFNNICIMNDDIIFDHMLFDKLGDLRQGVYGIINGDEKLNQPKSTDYSINFIKWKPGDIIHCFGQLFFLHKDNWKPIPDDLVITYGDDYVIHTHLINGKDVNLIYNIRFSSPGSQTVGDPTVELMSTCSYEKETQAYHKIVETEIKTLGQYNNQQINEVTQLKTILIAIPTAKNIEPTTFKSIYDLEIPDGYKAQFQYFYGYNVDQVRNLIADWVVRGFDYLFSVDYDIAFPPDTLKKLLSHDKDVVTGIYRQRLEPQTLEAYDLSLKNYPASELFSKPNPVQLGGCGFGCVLVKKKVFADVGYPQFVYHSAIDHRHTFSEDLDFCKKATEKGFKIWADTSILCDHYGTRVFTVDVPSQQPIALDNTSSDVHKRLVELSNMDLLPIRHTEFLRYMKDNGFNPNVVYDIGSCVLHWTKAAQSVWPNTKFYLFEAMEEVRALYNCTPHRYFLGPLYNQDRVEVPFYQNLRDPGGNSIFKENTVFSPMADKLFPEDQKQTKLARTLDSLTKENNLPVPDLIKIDVQGAELAVLQGAVEVLKRCNNIIVETQHVEYNLGGAKFEEVKTFLQNMGFVLRGRIVGDDTSVDADYFFSRG